MSMRFPLAVCAAVTVLAMAGCQQPSGSAEDSHESPAEQVAQDLAEEASDTTSSMEPSAEASQADPDQVMDRMASQVVGFAASSNAVGVACDMTSRAEAEASKAKSREMMQARGLSAAAHDQAYDAAFKKSVAKLDSAPAAKKAQACDEFKQMIEQASQMAPAS